MPNNYTPTDDLVERIKNEALDLKMKDRAEIRRLKLEIKRLEREVQELGRAARALEGPLRPRNPILRPFEDSPSGPD